MKNLDGVAMYVSRTSVDGVVGTSTRLCFRQWGDRVLARYAGGRVDRGLLAGRFRGPRLHVRFAQREADGAMHGGHSWCEVLAHDHRVRILEHFVWETRDGAGVNVFDEVEGDPNLGVSLPGRG